MLTKKHWGQVLEKHWGQVLEKHWGQVLHHADLALFIIN